MRALFIILALLGGELVAAPVGSLAVESGEAHLAAACGHLEGVLADPRGGDPSRLVDERGPAPPPPPLATAADGWVASAIASDPRAGAALEAPDHARTRLHRVAPSGPRAPPRVVHL